MVGRGYRRGAEVAVMGALLDAEVREHLVVLIVGLVALAAIGGAMVAVVMKALSIHRWLIKHFSALDASIGNLRTAIGDRFAQHEREEREWQGKIHEKLEDVRDRIARMEGQLSAAAEERVHRRAVEDQHAPRVEE
jgi:hypothetical protein